MEYVEIMGMLFEAGSEPDFRSIVRTKERSDGVHDYALFSADVERLSLIINAACGSTALCVDTGDIYVLMRTGWVKFGDSTVGSASVNSLNLTPLDIDRSAILSSDGQITTVDDRSGEMI